MLFSPIRVAAPAPDSDLRTQNVGCFRNYMCLEKFGSGMSEHGLIFQVVYGKKGSRIQSCFMLSLSKMLVNLYNEYISADAGLNLLL